MIVDAESELNSEYRAPCLTSVSPIQDSQTADRSNKNRFHSEIDLFASSRVSGYNLSLRGRTHAQEAQSLFSPSHHEIRSYRLASDRILPQRRLKIQREELRKGFEVVVRNRPLLQEEPVPEDGEYREIVLPDTDNEQLLVRDAYYNPVSLSNGYRVFNFDRVYQAQESNQTIYEESVQKMIPSVFEGFNATIFAYGITGSGKTHTMFGDSLRSKPTDLESLSQDTDLGISFRLINEIFQTAEEIESKGEKSISFNISYMEIYNEQIIDLLQEEANEKQELLLHPPPQFKSSLPSSPRSSVNNPYSSRSNAPSIVIHRPSSRESSVNHNKNGRSAFKLLNGQMRAQRRQNSAPPLFITENQDGTVILPNLTQYRVKNIDEVKYLVMRGNQHRTIAQTSTNLFSSRSHAILQLTVTQNFLNQEQSMNLVSKVSLIDLAGSERANNIKTRKSVQRLFEGQNINRSLLALANCINILAKSQSQKNVHIPYRDSKLTRLLKDSLGGSTPTLMITCISLNPHMREETLNTINYASRARHIKKCVKANIVQEETKAERATKVRELQGELEELKEKLEERNKLIQRMQKELENKEIYEEDQENLSTGRVSEHQPSKLMNSLLQDSPEVGKKVEFGENSRIQPTEGFQMSNILDHSIASDSCITKSFNFNKSIRMMNRTELRRGNLAYCDQMMHTMQQTDPDLLRGVFDEGELQEMRSTVDYIKKTVKQTEMKKEERVRKQLQRVQSKPQLQDLFKTLEKKIKTKELLIDEALRESQEQSRCLQDLKDFVRGLLDNDRFVIRDMQEPEEAYQAMASHPRLSSLVASDEKVARFLAKVLAKFTVEQKMVHRSHDCPHSSKNPFQRELKEGYFKKMETRCGESPEQNRNGFAINARHFSSICSNFDFTEGTEELGPAFVEERIKGEKENRPR